MEELKEYDLTYNEGTNPDRLSIDFEINDGYDNVCFVWGEKYPEDINVECDHPGQCLNFGDDDEQGECLLCGATCDWKWVPDGEGGQEREIGQWHYKVDEAGGIIKKILERSIK